MTFKEIKSWAKKYGYEILKEKNTENYLWTKIDTPSATGLAVGIGEVATQIYNDITNYTWVEYQEQYKKKAQSNIKFNP
jgi:hypothetical protein